MEGQIEREIGGDGWKEMSRDMVGDGQRVVESS